MKTLYIDIETAPALAYIWGLKTRYVPISQVAEDGYILCFAYRWDHEDEVGFWSLWDQGHEAMIQAAWELLNEADHVVTYNGGSFDIPRLNSEFLVGGYGPPQPYYHTDLFLGVRKFRVLSKSMNHMLKLLDLDTKLEHKGMDLWTGVMDGNKEDQAVMEEYNVQDVIVMKELYEVLYPWLDHVPNMSLWMEADPEGKLKCRCGSTNLRFKGYKKTKVLRYKQYHCRDCKSWMRERYTVDKGPNRREDVLTW